MADDMSQSTANDRAYTIRINRNHITRNEVSLTRKALAANIATYRKKLGLSRAELGKKISVTELGIGQYERGDRTPPIEILCKLADTFNILVDELLGRRESEYDAVKEYRFETASTLIQKFGLEAVETHTQNISVCIRLNSALSYKNIDGVLFSEPLNDNTPILYPVITFKDKEDFYLFVEKVMEQFALADGAKTVMSDTIAELRETGNFLPIRLEVLRGGGIMQRTNDIDGYYE